MSAPLPVTVIRHPKERVAKCSLRFLHARPEITFLTARPGMRFCGRGFTLLAVGAPELTPADRGRPLLLLDSTWRWLPKLRACVTGDPVERSLPHIVKTTYPRVSRVFEDPEGGLASVEALYLAKRILGEDDQSLLDGYRWKEELLAQLRGRMKDEG